MSERGFPKMWPFRQAERKNSPEAYTTEHLAKIVQESFFMSQGSLRSQRGILSLFLRKHPEALAGIRALRGELMPNAPAKEDLPESVWKEGILAARDGETRDNQVMGWEEKYLPLDDEAFAKNPILAKLVDDGVKFILAPWHPKPPELRQKKDDGTYGEFLPPAEMKAKARELSVLEMQGRFRSLFMVDMAVASGEARTMTEAEAMRKLVDDMIEQDRWRLRHSAENRDGTDNTASEAFKMRIKRGVSFIAKYALSKNRNVAQERFPEELREVWETVGAFVRKNRGKFSAKTTQELTELLGLYETHDESHERITI